ncbi:MAG: lysophospholipid acyltransferase family protein [Thermomicrobiales bacterium]
MAPDTRNLMPQAAWLTIRTLCRLGLRRITVRASGMEHIPQHGPVILAARHYHYTWDGIAIFARVNRQLRAVAAVDWLPPGRLRGALLAACAAAGWPAIMRDPLRGEYDRATERERRGLLLQATRDAIEVLREGRPLLIFPEGYPVIDPHPTPTRAEGELLPFQPGVLRIALLAARQLGQPIPIVPIGLRYTPGRRWTLDLRVGEPLLIGPQANLAEAGAALEAEVRRLSGIA